MKPWVNGKVISINSHSEGRDGTVTVIVLRHGERFVLLGSTLGLLTNWWR